MTIIQYGCSMVIYVANASSTVGDCANDKLTGQASRATQLSGATFQSAWDMSDAGRRDLASSLAEIARLLRADGRFVSITFAQPHFRLPYYAVADYDWSCEVHKLGTYFHFFAYRMVKTRPLDYALIEPYLYPLRSSQRDASRSSSAVHCADDDDDDADWLATIDVFDQ